MNKKSINHFETEIIKQACSFYGIAHKEIKLIRSNSNLIYDCGNKILRISHSETRTKIEIEAELDWVSFLKRNGLSVVKIIPSNSNNLLEQIEDEKNHFTIVCFDKIKGGKITKDKWDAPHFERLGSLTGLLHKTGKKYLPKKNLIYKHWDKISEFETYKFLPKDKRELAQLYHVVVGQIN